MAGESNVQSTTSSPEHEPETADVSTGYANYVLFVLFVVYVFNFMDRQVLSIVVPDLKQELGFSDTQIGLLGGFAFSLLYTIAGIPIARIADRSTRRNVIAIGLFAWSGLTAVTALAGNFWHFLAARIGVGIGEAAGSPPSHSLIVDYFPMERRATALSIYGMGVYVGIAMAMIAGGYIASNFGWRTVYTTLGIAGIPLVLVVRYTIREIPRGNSDRIAARAAAARGKQTAHAAPPAEQPALLPTLSKIVRNRPLMLVITATALQSLAGYGIMLWGAPFLMRVHQMPQTEVGLKLGLIFGLAGGGGVVFGGWLADRWGQLDERWFMRLPAIQAVVGMPFLITFLMLDDTNVALASFVVFYFVAAMYIGPMFAMTQSLVPAAMRATASAINLFVVNLIGLGLGPFLMGFLNDALHATYGDLSIRYSILSVGIVGGLAAVPFYLASRNLPEDLAAVRGK